MTLADLGRPPFPHRPQFVEPLDRADLRVARQELLAAYEAALAPQVTTLRAALANASPYTKVIGEGRRKVYRARFTGFESREAAIEAIGGKRPIGRFAAERSRSKKRLSPFHDSEP